MASSAESAGEASSRPPSLNLSLRTPHRLRPPQAGGERHPNSMSEPRPPDLVEAICAVLPQTQCQRCGYSGCAPYAEALARQEALINRCPPGGLVGMQRLAQITGQAPLAIDSGCGQEKPLTLAMIDETRCIGCALCIAACPVDAIVGGFKFMHTVLAEDCTGCELCLPACPVDCISLVRPSPAREWASEDAKRSRSLHERRQQRLARAPTESPRPSSRADLLEAARKRARARTS